MIGKTVIGRSFRGCIAYNMAKVTKGLGEVLDSRGIRDFDAVTMTRDFNSRKILNPKLTRCVWHTSLSFQDRLPNDRMLEITHEWMKRMSLSNTQYVIIRHTDTKHHHVHIVANRINDECLTIPDNNNWKRSEAICQDLVKSFALTPIPDTRNEQRINRKKLKGRDLLKTDINRSIRQIISRSADMNDFSRRMSASGFNCIIRTNPDGSLRGLSFERDGITIKASNIHHTLSARQIEHTIKQNRTSSLTELPENSQSAKSGHSIPVIAKLGNALNSEDESDRQRRRRRKDRDQEPDI